MSDDGEQGDVKMMGPQIEVKQNITKSVQSFRRSGAHEKLKPEVTLEEIDYSKPLRLRPI